MSPILRTRDVTPCLLRILLLMGLFGLSRQEIRKASLVFDIFLFCLRTRLGDNYTGIVTETAIAFLGNWNWRCSLKRYDT